jgi:hypothetical protein
MVLKKVFGGSKKKNLQNDSFVTLALHQMLFE